MALLNATRGLRGLVSSASVEKTVLATRGYAEAAAASTKPHPDFYNESPDGVERFPTLDELEYWEAQLSDAQKSIFWTPKNYWWFQWQGEDPGVSLFLEWQLTSPPAFHSFEESPCIRHSPYHLRPKEFEELEEEFRIWENEQREVRHSAVFAAMRDPEIVKKAEAFRLEIKQKYRVVMFGGQFKEGV
eukprot:TRINITY_DN3180_c0_g1_i1.p1 TRINITY_DN3180_c0_g1~~TRINITY_DN3180_c0_g1_i1.p1  ORF type:complete len:188 (-),score=45.02 TRINITY_DN3180_c0_g1_i1:138-701(-)